MAKIRNLATGKEEDMGSCKITITGDVAILNKRYVAEQRIIGLNNCQIIVDDHRDTVVEVPPKSK